jgi:hypothetical protein
VEGLGCLEGGDVLPQAFASNSLAKVIDLSVPPDTTNRLLDRLAEAKRQFGEGAHHTVAEILTQLARRKFKDAESLICFHEILLFLRAYPQSARLVQLSEDLLATFAQRIKVLRDAEADLSLLDDPEVSGIAGTAVTDTFAYNIVRWLLRRHPTQVSFDWDWFDDENRLAATWPRFFPLLEEDAAVEANVPYRKWLQEARGGKSRELPWLVERFASLPLTAKEQAELYESLKLYVRWTPAYRATRTGMRLPARSIFYHRQPLIRRKDVSLVKELQAAPTVLQRLSRSQGQQILDMTRETSTIRYRELYGFTHGDPARVLKASIGRGVELFFSGLPPQQRLPLRAYQAVFIFKNGVPVGYFEGLSICERMESGFNFYYTFREGETAWIYAKTLALLRQIAGVTVFTIDPYQVGYDNQEGIESGAFWFYRKLGFRPTRPKLLQLALAEERKIAGRPGYRTAARVLRQLAEGHMIFELPERQTGEWDRFQVRKLGMAVQRRMAKEFSGEAARIRSESVKAVTRALGVRMRDWQPAELTALSDLSLVLALIPDLSRWSADEKRDVVRIISARAGADESRYLRLLQKHTRLRGEIIRLGS